MTDAIRHADARSALARLECWRATRDKLGECPYGSPATFAADVSALLSTVEQMREALKPFAKAGELFGPRWSDDYDQLIYGPAAGPDYSIAADDLRRARDLLAALPPTPQEDKPNDR